MAAAWRVPGYTELRELGTGGGGRVVLAVHDDSGTHVAIRYLSERLRSDPAFLARFQSEARRMVEVRDPHVAHLYEYRQTAEGDAAVVTELVNGVPLRAILREHGAFVPEVAFAVLKSSLLGLAAVHRAGVVHRDVKPENVLIGDDGSGKIVDVGIAVPAEGPGSPAGTASYLAPELWEDGPATPASDIYAATAVFFECMTGHRPFQAVSRTILRHQHQSAPVPIEEVPEPTRELIAEGMAKDPRERPASAEAFLVEMERVAQHAYGPDWEDRGRRWLGELAALLVLLFPLGQQPVPSDGSSPARSALRRIGTAVRDNASRLAVGASVTIVAAGTTAYILAATTPPTSRLDVAAAPSVPAASPTGSLAGDSPTPRTPTPIPKRPADLGLDEPAPDGPRPTAGSSVPVAIDPEPDEDTGNAGPDPTPTPSRSASPTASATRSPTATPTPSPSRTPTPSATPTASETPTSSPTTPPVSEPPADITEPPADTTEPPADITEPPADITEPPADTTEPPT